MDQAAFFGSHVTVGIAMSHIVEWLKGKHWFPLLDQLNAAWVNRMVVALIALGTSLGIHTTADWATGTVTITGLSSGSIADHAWDWFQQFVLMHGYWKVAIAPDEARKNTW